MPKLARPKTVAEYLGSLRSESSRIYARGYLDHLEKATVPPSIKMLKMGGNTASRIRQFLESAYGPPDAAGRRNPIE